MYTELIAEFDRAPSIARAAVTARKLDREHSANPGLFTEISLLVVRNYTFEPLETALRIEAYRLGIALQVGYTGYEPGAPSTFEQIEADRPDAVLLAFRLDQTPSRNGDSDPAGEFTELLLGLAARVRDCGRQPVLIHNLIAPTRVDGGLRRLADPYGPVNFARDVNHRLAQAAATADGEMLHVVDIDHAVACVGAAGALLPRATEQLVPYTPVGMTAIAGTTGRHISALRGARAKCVAVDADNTLWKGVVGEDGIDGLTIEGRHRELQEELLDLRSRGILLAIASKNERHDVERVLSEHPDCPLSAADFVAMEINWEDKATNLRRIADDLSIGIDRFVFVDDNPVECEWVREQLPQVRTVQWPVDLGPEGRLDDLALFDALVVTAEDRDRTTMYHAESERKEARREALSHEDYMRSLAMVANVGPAEPSMLRRVAQLLQRTNQFNLTTRRHDLAFLERALDDPDIDILVLELTDRFGPSGLIACAIVRYEGGTADFDTLLMSCRVIGRDVERLLVSHAADRARAAGMRELRGRYIASDRNAQVEDLYPRLGFEATDEPDVWVRSLEQPFDAPDWIEVRPVTSV